MIKYDAHILVVDDDDGIRSLVKQYLNENNFLVTTAKDAEDAKEKVSIIKFDIIVLDIMMPGKSGLDFTIENKEKINTPIILLTAKGEADERIIEVASKYDAIGITSIFSQQETQVLHCAKIIKKQFPNKLLFSGGVNAKSRSSIFFTAGFDIILTSEYSVRLLYRSL